jgi:hypothetical protein
MRVSIIILCLYIYSAVFAGDIKNKTFFKKRIYTTEKITSVSPLIDGKLDDACWQEGEWSENYIQQTPVEGGEPSQNTQMKVLYDDEYIYVAIRAFDTEMNKIQKYKGRRDEFTGDAVGVCFDSYFDHRTGFEFDLTAGGSKIDLIFMNDGIDMNWNPVWFGEVGTEKDAWVAEMKIPLSQLRFNKDTDQVWGLHAWRWINRNMEEVQWNLIPRQNSGAIYNFGELHGISNLPSRKNIELSPYVSAKTLRNKPEDGNPFATGKKNSWGTGLDAKVGITNDFTLDVTINPDFGQIESDPSVMNLSQFETYFEEKRSFFLEGRNILSFRFGGDELFYSRRIGRKPSYDPDISDGEYKNIPDFTNIYSAVKLTGKSKNGLSVGIVQSITSEEKAEIHSSQANYTKTVEPLTSYTVARVQKDINKGNTIIGGIITSVNRFMNEDYLTEKLNKSAYVGGFDFTHYWKNRTYFINGKAISSVVNGSAKAISELQLAPARYYKKPDASYLHYDSTRTSLSGTGAILSLGRGGDKKLRLNETFSYKSPGIELNDLGYHQRCDYIKQESNIYYNESEPKGIFRSYDFSFYQVTTYDFGGKLTQNDIALRMSAMFKNKWGVYFSPRREFGSVNSRILRGGPDLFEDGNWNYYMYLHTDESKPVSFYMDISQRINDDKISYANWISPGVSMKISNALNVGANVGLQGNRNSLQWVDGPEIGNKTEYLLAQIDQKTMSMTLRLNYTFTPSFTLQYYGSPFISTGKYSKYKRMIHSTASSFKNRFVEYPSSLVIYNSEDEKYEINDTELAKSFTFDNPNFNFTEFRSNLVARWEYKAGSVFYLVWSHQRSVKDENFDTSMHSNVNTLWNSYPTNVLMLKFNYWFSI